MAHDPSTTTREEILALVQKVTAEQLGIAESEVVEEAAFAKGNGDVNLDADSLDLVELIMSFEEEFGVEIADDVAESLVTVKDAVDYVDKHRSEWGTGTKKKTDKK